MIFVVVLTGGFVDGISSSSRVRVSGTPMDEVWQPQTWTDLNLCNLIDFKGWGGFHRGEKKEKLQHVAHSFHVATALCALWILFGVSIIIFWRFLIKLIGFYRKILTWLSKRKLYQAVIRKHSNSLPSHSYAILDALKPIRARRRWAVHPPVDLSSRSDQRCPVNLSLSS